MARDPQIEEIRSRLNIVDIISATVRLKKAGKDWKGLCPFHDDKNPSFAVSPSLQRYNCWACGKSGDIFTFVQETEHLDFPQALEKLAGMAGVTLRKGFAGPARETDGVQASLAEAVVFFREQLSRSQMAQEFLDKRGVSKDMSDRFAIGFAPSFGDALATTLLKRGMKLEDARRADVVKPEGNGFADRFLGRLMFPIKDVQGRLVGFGGRALGDSQPKYLNTQDTELFKKRRLLYGLDLAKSTIASEGFAILVEGYLDVVACHAVGLANAVAALGTATSEEHGGILKRWTDKVVVMFDADDAGIRAALRSARILSEGGLEVAIAKLPAGEDPDSLVKSGGAVRLRRLAEDAVSPIAFELENMETHHDLTKPAGAEAYVNQAITVLAAVKSELERDKHIEQVARLLPSFHLDRKRAESVVRTEISRLTRKEAKATVRMEGPPKAKTLGAVDKAEIGLIRAACDPEWAGVAWPFLDPELCINPERRAVVEALHEAFLFGPPEGSAAEILGEVEDEQASQTLTAILMMEWEPLSEKYLEDLHSYLVRMDKRRLQSEAARSFTEETAKSDPAWQEYCKHRSEQ